MMTSEPQIWITSLQRGAYRRAFTPDSPASPPPQCDVYIGRAMGSRTASPLANPYPLPSEEERSEVLKRYAAWLQHELHTQGPAFHELLRLLSLATSGGVVLCCWCAPRLCHGQEIRQALLALHATGWTARPVRQGGSA